MDGTDQSGAEAGGNREADREENREEDSGSVRPTDAMPAAEADERALLAAFDRMSPQGSLRWGFDDAMRRVAEPETDVAAEPWPGLPADLWERGRSARVGQRFVGDVAGVMAEVLANDARKVAAAVAAGVNVATWDALRYLAARVEALEGAADPAGLEAAELSPVAPDLGGWSSLIASLLGSPDPARPVLVGESGAGALARRLLGLGWRVEGVEPRARPAWDGFAAGAGGPGGAIVVAQVLDHLLTVPPDARAGVVLAGCVDRSALVTKVGLLEEAVRVTRPGGSVVVVATDQGAWDEALDPTTRDLAPGRPLHPETWSVLFRRAGLAEVAWHRHDAGALHAVSGRVGP